MSSSDFISWDDEDLNLEVLLGEYTDYEPVSEKDDDSTKVPHSNVYICPECKKTFRSIAGFRGHVMKKHGLNIKGKNNAANIQDTSISILGFLIFVLLT